MTDKKSAAPKPVFPETETRTFWDEVALTKWGSYLIETEARLVVKALELAGKPSTGIDLGCGSGRWSKLVSDAGWRMTCIDADQQALTACQQRVPGAHCVLADPTASVIPCPPNSARLLACIEVGEVIEAEWFIPEASRVLEMEGVLVGVMWNRHSWRGLACRLKYYLTSDPNAQYYYNHTYASWKEKLAAAGLEMEYEEGLCWGPAGRTSNSFMVPIYVWMEEVFKLNRLIGWSPWIAFIARRKS
jgi:SAM-dependent methyltransferase